MQTQHTFRFTPYLSYMCLLILSSLTFVSCKKQKIVASSTLPEDISNQAYVEILEDRLSKLPLDAQVAIALVHDGQTEYLGITNENKVLSSVANADKVFEAGSITKVFTSICLSELIAANEASLSENLQDQFDFTLKAGGEITLQQLANHTSGLPSLPTNVDEVQGFNIEDPYVVYTYDNLKSYLQNQVALNTTSGTTYAYSNLATGMLGYVLAQKRNSTYEALLRDIVFDPLGMNATTTVLGHVDASNLVEPRDPDGQVVSHWNFAETMAGAGSIKSSVADMAIFIRKNFEEDSVYNLPQEKTFETDDNAYMGLGWIIWEEDDATIHLHDGGTGGFSTILMLDKDRQIGAVIFSNVEDYHDAIVPMCREFMEEIRQ